MVDEARKCPHLKADEDEPWVRVISHGDFSIGFRLYAWVPDVEELWSCRWWLCEHIKKRLDAEDIEIPFPYRTVVYKKDLPAPRRDDAAASHEAG